MKKKNIILIYADDLGRGMLSCYGQRVIKTEQIDRLAKEGMRYTNACATAFCAPARAALICGIHDAHAGRWTYTPGAYYKKLSTGELTFEQLQETLQNSGINHHCNGKYIASIAKNAGYRTAEIGKLEWGFSTTANDMFNHGWDYHFGYYDHIRCHGFYPPFLFENGERINIDGNTDPHCGRPSYSDDVDEPIDMSFRKVYSQDLFDEKCISFIRENKDRPFFLFHPTQLPHGPTFYHVIHPQVEKRNDLSNKEKQYASMVLRLDQTVGKIIDEVERLGIRDNTIIIFTSDNGHEPGYRIPGRCLTDRQLDGIPVNQRDNPFRTTTCGDVFNGNDGMAGLKFTNWNGGCVVPFIASCPGFVQKGVECNSLISNYDLLATVAEICGEPTPDHTDGISILSLLKSQSNPKLHDYIVYASKDGPAIVTQDGWKLRVFIPVELWQTSNASSLYFHPEACFQLYNLHDDFSEMNDLSCVYPEITEKLKSILLKECDGNLFNGTPMAHLAQPPYPIPGWDQIVEGII